MSVVNSDWFSSNQNNWLCATACLVTMSVTKLSVWFLFVVTPESSVSNVLLMLDG